MAPFFTLLQFFFETILQLALKDAAILQYIYISYSRIFR